MSIFDFFRKSKPGEPKQEVLDEPSTPNIALDSSSYVNDSEVSLKKKRVLYSCIPRQIQYWNSDHGRQRISKILPV